MSRSQSSKSMSLALAAAGLLALGSLGACDKKPSSPPTPKTGSAKEGPTAASGGPPSADYPAGIKPAPSGDQVAAASTHKGPSEGGTAIGGMASGQAASSGNSGATAPTGGDGKAAPSNPSAPSR